MTVERTPAPHAAPGARPSVAAVWWRAARPFSLTASLTPVLVGVAAAHHDGRFDLLRALATLLGAVAIQVGTNLINDYYDYVRGVDEPGVVGPSGVIHQGLLPPEVVRRGGLVAFGVGAALGLWLAASAGWPILVLGVLSVLAGYAYTGGPLPLGYVGLGDLVVCLFMGPGIVLGAYYVQTRALGPTPLWASLPLAALVTAILVVNNLRDLESDRRKGKRTLATLLGRSGTLWEYALLVAAAYATLVGGAVAGALPPLALASLLTLPAAWRTWQAVRTVTDPPTLTREGLRGTARLHQHVGLVLAAALAVT
ncbi:MAG: 1,4-dihydroxy-2-naphthoate octaprenyltransferase [Armatimonadota bacterium]|nr:1,4-dihydroxy-2-naphthoate octaprenyltransferase [Armatimonadota bacterium]MDR7458869.1 1,4-dihydroxy-2-naphthoate octaprenyltransferase [Armatimonadota bacterium]MDR7479155.1 1,4-dihydroxy-2-naphthoate octaprenyltransferase [Armatimonadota bacterium]MDR7487633.1 1,4-dihydroxy-2-naphthoate octaprenyltransferase [Armatimonadota bacterium]MDR7491411.1 1,4-dihydroxy-2-naphthoate octaprenyltransferase [Armatimonadota bacterium]